MSAHTPGPWMVEPHADDFDGAISIVSAYVRDDLTQRRTANWIAECDLQDDRIEENHANAQLIAAAPDLLAALRGLIAAIDRAPDRPCGAAALETARAVIAQAEAR